MDDLPEAGRAGSLHFHVRRGQHDRGPPPLGIHRFGPSGLQDARAEHFLARLRIRQAESFVNDHARPRMPHARQRHVHAEQPAEPLALRRDMPRTLPQDTPAPTASVGAMPSAQKAASAIRRRVWS